MLLILFTAAPLFPYELVPADVDDVFDYGSLRDKHNPRNLPSPVHLER